MRWQQYNLIGFLFMFAAFSLIYLFEEVLKIKDAGKWIMVCCVVPVFIPLSFLTQMGMYKDIREGISTFFGRPQLSKSLKEYQMPMLIALVTVNGLLVAFLILYGYLQSR